jgi:fructose/tagatose bisphosphate aldolase
MLTPRHCTDWGGEPFLAFCVNLAHSASVPIAVHLDHATTEEDIDTALTFAERGTAFDSIMVDASHADTDEENLEEVSSLSNFKCLHVDLSSRSVDVTLHGRPRPESRSRLN